MRLALVTFFYRIAYYIVRFVFFFYYNLTFENRGAIPKKGAAIYASNHRSFLDPVLVAMAAKGPMNYIAKEELFQNPVFSGFIRFMGAFPTSNQKDPTYNMLDEAGKRLRAGRNLTIFPEGTRHTDGVVGRGKSGMCVLSASSEMPIIPIGLVFDSNNLHFRSKIRVRVGEPFYPRDYGLGANSDPRAMRGMREDVMASIKKMVEENPPFPITHDAPKKKTTIELEKEKKKREREAKKEESTQ